MSKKPTNGHAATSNVCGADASLHGRQTVLVFQGGGALGAYQAGVYQALHEKGIEPDWIIGTSIGAINAGLIAGNRVEDRLPKLEEFWNRMAQKTNWHDSWFGAQLTAQLAFAKTIASGIPGFFEPQLAAFLGPNMPLGAEKAGYYSTGPLKRTLTDLIDNDILNSGAPRLTVGAAHVRTSQMRYFDSRDESLDVRHIMASGALPPAFPAVRIDGELYWDGGILSNTPTEAIFDDYPRRNSLIFAVHLWNPIGPEPETLQEVQHRQKDIQYSSRVASHIERQKETHQLRHVINELLQHVPAKERDSEAVQELAGHGCLTQMHVLRLLSPRLAAEDQTKDIDFSPATIHERWNAGYAATRSAIEAAPWEAEADPLEGVILHEADTRGRWGKGKEKPVPVVRKPIEEAVTALPH